jgi:putative transposase
MAFDFERRSRQTIRLREYDYSLPEKYFITICTLNRECLLGEIREKKLIVSPAGEIVRREWLHTSVVREEIELDAFTIMPNHLHGIISIRSRRGDPAGRPEKIMDADRAILDRAPQQDVPALKVNTIGAIVGQFKSKATKKIRESTYPGFYWQRNYYEHIIRNESELQQIRRYILANPENWIEDQDNPLNF